MVAAPPPLTRAERVVLACCLALLGLAYVWASRYRLDPLDEGYFIYTSSRVFAGELPYRDFSTPYTPAFFYLNAALFKLFGLDLMTLRVSLVVCRALLLLLLYLLARRLMPPLFAALPVWITLAEEQAPGVWESHPAWWATLAFVGAVWCVYRHCERGQLRWWLGAGVAAGVSFAFKQNLGLFALAGLICVALTESSALPDAQTPPWLARMTLPIADRPLRQARQAAVPGSLLALGFGVGWGMRHHLDPLVLFVYLVPFGALALERLRAVRRERPAPGAGPGPNGVAVTRARLGLALGGFLAVTLPWLLALVRALGADETPFAAFVGAIDTDGYYLAMEPTHPSLFSILWLLLLGSAAIWALGQPWPRIARLGTVLGTLALAAASLEYMPSGLAQPQAGSLRPAGPLSAQTFSNAILYAPAAAFWGAYAWLVADRTPSPTGFKLRWLLLAGSLLLLNQYPRMDEPHVVFSGALLWIAAAYALWRLYLVLTRSFGTQRVGRLSRLALLLAVLALPFAAVWPSLEVRRSEVLKEQPGAALGVTPHYVPLDLPGASVLETDEFAWKYQQIAAYLQQYTRPDERIFVYPAVPLMYYLVDRPNATRFNHVLPGLLSPADEQETIRRLASVPASYVIWDSFGAEYWGKPGVYRALTDYIWENYDPVESIGGFEIMRRRTS